MPEQEQEVITLLEAVHKELQANHGLKCFRREFALQIEVDCDIALLSKTIAQAVKETGKTVYSLEAGCGGDGKIVLIVKC